MGAMMGKIGRSTHDMERGLYSNTGTTFPDEDLMDKTIEWYRGPKQHIHVDMKGMMWDVDFGHNGATPRELPMGVEGIADRAVDKEVDDRDPYQGTQQIEKVVDKSVDKIADSIMAGSLVLRDEKGELQQAFPENQPTDESVPQGPTPQQRNPGFFIGGPDSGDSPFSSPIIREKRKPDLRKFNKALIKFYEKAYPHLFNDNNGNCLGYGTEGMTIEGALQFMKDTVKANR